MEKRSVHRIAAALKPGGIVVVQGLRLRLVAEKPR
jgi:hypothetical protein